MDNPSKEQVPLKQSKVNNVDDIFERLGGFGRFQTLILVLILCLEIPTALVVFSPVFTSVNPKIWTWMCDNETIVSQDDLCSCNGTLSSTTSSIVSEWKLICDLEWVPDFITTIQMMGILIGNAVFGQLADWYGRKKAYLGSVALLASGTMISAVSPNLYVYAASRVLCGAGFSGFVMGSGVFAMEFMVPKWRVVCSSVGPLGEGIMLLGLLGYIFQDSWRNLLWATVLPFVVIFFTAPFIPESPRWLLRRQRLEDAHEVFNYVARVNKRPRVDIEVLKILADSEKTGNESNKKITYYEFFKDKHARFTAICLICIWGCWGLMYFGISFNLKNIGGNPYFNVVLLGVCDAVGYPASFLMNSLISRRQSVAAFMTSAATTLVTLAVIQLIVDVTDKPVLVLTLSLLGKFAAAGARASLRTLTGESFPTAVRNTGFGIVGSTSSLIGLLAPQIAFLGSKWPSAPLFIFAVCSLIGASMSFLIRETKGMTLQEGVNNGSSKSKRGSITKIIDGVRRLSHS